MVAGLGEGHLDGRRNLDSLVPVDVSAAHDPLRLARLPDRDIQMAIGHLHRGRASQVGSIEVVEVQSPKVKPGVLEQCRGKPLL